MPKRIHPKKKSRRSNKTRAYKKPKSTRRRYRRRNMTGRGCPCQMGAKTNREIPPAQPIQMGGNSCAGAVPLLGGTTHVQRGGDTFPIRTFYPLNPYNHDPNYTQISERAIPQMGRGVRTAKRGRGGHSQSGGGMMTDITNSVSNAFSSASTGFSNLMGDTGKGLSTVLTSVSDPILGQNLSKSALLTQGNALGAGVSNQIATGQTSNAPERLGGIYDVNHLPKA